MTAYAKHNINYLDRTAETKAVILCENYDETCWGNCKVHEKDRSKQLCRLPGNTDGTQVMGLLLEYINGMTYKKFVEVYSCPKWPKVLL